MEYLLPIFTFQLLLPERTRWTWMVSIYYRHVLAENNCFWRVCSAVAQHSQRCVKSCHQSLGIFMSCEFSVERWDVSHATGFVWLFTFPHRISRVLIGQLLWQYFFNADPSFHFTNLNAHLIHWLDWMRVGSHLRVFWRSARSDGF